MQLQHAKAFKISAVPKWELYIVDNLRRVPFNHFSWNELWYGKSGGWLLKMTLKLFSRLTLKNAFERLNHYNKICYFWLLAKYYEHVVSYVSTCMSCIIRDDMVLYVLFSQLFLKPTCKWKEFLLLCLGAPGLPVRSCWNLETKSSNSFIIADFYIDPYTGISVHASYTKVRAYKRNFLTSEAVWEKQHWRRTLRVSARHSPTR